MSDKIEFSRAEVVELIRQIGEMTISLNSIGSAAIDLPEGEWEKAVVEYIVETSAVERLSSCRAILSAKFEDEPLGEDDESGLSRELNDTKYWDVSEYRSKHGL